MAKNLIKQQQVQRQKLSHQNIQLFKMMELNLLQFDQKVKEELDGNPALENLDHYDDSKAYSLDRENEHRKEDASVSSDSKDDYFHFNNSVQASDDFESYKSQKDYTYSNSDEDEKDFFIPVRDEDSILDNLLNQLKYYPITPKQLVIGEYIIGNLDDDGYLRRDAENISDDLAFRNNISTTNEEIQAVIQLIQDLDPPGIGASTLQECLLLQLYRKKQNKTILRAAEIIEYHFELFSKKQYDKLIKKLKITDVEFEEIKKEILQLNPKPTEKNLNEEVLGRYIIPDFLVYRQDNKLELELHSYNQPNLAISQDFVGMLKKIKEDKKKSKQDKEAHEYIQDKISKANLFISLIKERQETMIIIMNCILQIQSKFFMTGDEAEIKPMTLKNIAELTSFDISTVSRVTSSKFVQTEFGVFSLKFFFSEGLLNDEGEEVSTRRIIKKLEEIVQTEDKSNPFSDDQLTEELKKHGFIIARRTTAKYRENLNIPPKHLRKISYNDE